MIIPVSPERHFSWGQWLDKLLDDGLRKAIDAHPGYDPDDVRRAIAGNSMQFFVTGELDMGVITQLIEYPRARVLFVLFAGGHNLKMHYDDMLAVIRAFARTQGCAEIHAVGRKGWSLFEEADLMFYKVAA